MIDLVHRIVIGAPVTPNELRCAGAFVLAWFLMDAAWFLGTLNHWWGL